MSKINYVKGDATAPQGEGLKIIVHVCNDIGAWGAGFVMALSKKWEQPEKSYREAQEYKLGEVELVLVEDDIIVANMIGQRNIGFDKNGKPPIRYAAVGEALASVSDFAKENNATIHMPRIGCGLAGGRWDVIESVLKTNVKVDVTVYDFD